MEAAGVDNLAPERGCARCPKSGTPLADSRGQRERVAVALAAGVSPRRFEGWEPEEVHEHFDQDGTFTGRTIVTREPEWDDEARRKVLAYAAYEHMKCQRGHHPSTGMDATKVRMVENARVACLDCEAEDARRAQWMKSHRHKDDGTCDCRHQVFWVDRHEPIPDDLLPGPFTTRGDPPAAPPR
ncbi:hypothetical protein HMPREF0063_10051 [Aeromicrobium marinum DSM 15272]|uniref:Uncharacterized protein n=1 Tax=Aeromicrobium marinum DSM 15272 TaxID=585531 RepID=E2S7P4_9ACTN|nr:hypothetical protein HMPREF0063_10051 [Aeromicrobium marinum DSM 15272]